MNFGLDKETIEIILSAIKSFPDIEEAIVFGSRAMGNFKDTSDIDIALKGKLTETTVATLQGKLDEAPRFPYKVDILDFNAISNAELIKHIETFGKVLYTKNVKARP